MSDTVVRDSITLRPQGPTGRTARRFVILTLRRWRVVGLIFRASQVVTELVDRAAVRSGHDLELVLIRRPQAVRIELYGGSEADPLSTAEVRRPELRGS